MPSPFDFDQPLKTCVECGVAFDARDPDLWHCRVCDHHWQMHVAECRNCHQGRRPGGPDVYRDPEEN